jgi:hypothetical protein
MGRAGLPRQSVMVISDWLGSFFAMIDALPAWQLYGVVGLLLVLETTVLIGLITPGEVVLLGDHRGQRRGVRGAGRRRGGCEPGRADRRLPAR